MQKFEGTSFRVSDMISRMNLALFSAEPPYASVRRFVYSGSETESSFKIQQIIPLGSKIDLVKLASSH